MVKHTQILLLPSLPFSFSPSPFPPSPSPSLLLSFPLSPLPSLLPSLPLNVCTRQFYLRIMVGTGKFIYIPHPFIATSSSLSFPESGPGLGES